MAVGPADVGHAAMAELGVRGHSADGVPIDTLVIWVEADDIAVGSIPGIVEGVADSSHASECIVPLIGMVLVMWNLEMGR